MHFTEDEVLVPEEHENFPGYYKIPGVPWLVINRDGDCLSTHTGNKAAPYPVNGYWHVSCLIPKEVKTDKWSRYKAQIHRLLALTFIGRPAKFRHIPFELLTVNHIDHVRSNHTLSNLEWGTQLHNMQAASDFGVFGHAAKVAARDIRSGVVQIFTSVQKCADHFGLARSELHKHLKGKWAGHVTHDWHVFKYMDEVPWPNISVEDQVESKWFHEGYVLMVRADGSGRVMIFNTLLEVVNYLGVPISKLKNFRIRHGPLSAFDGWIITYYDTVMGHDISGLKAPENRRMKPKGTGKRVKISDRFTNLSNVYDSAAQASKAMGVSPETIHNSAKENRSFAVHFKAEYVDE